MHRLKEVGIGSYAQKEGRHGYLCIERRWAWVAMHRKEVGMTSYAWKGGGHEYSYEQKGGGQDQLCIERSWEWLAMHGNEVGITSYAQKGQMFLYPEIALLYDIEPGLNIGTCFFK